MRNKELFLNELKKRISRNKERKIWEEIPEKRNQLIIEGQLLGELKHFVESMQEKDNTPDWLKELESMPEEEVRERLEKVNTWYNEQFADKDIETSPKEPQTDIEKPVNEDLEKEISLFLLRNEIINHSENGLKNYVTNVARHFANWQREQIMNGVEEAAKEYSRSITEGNVIDECFVEDFKAGAIWREQQMMQNAVKGVVTSFTDHNHLCIMLDVPTGSWNYCDRVEVIIIKKE